VNSTVIALAFRTQNQNTVKSAQENITSIQFLLDATYKRLWISNVSTCVSPCGLVWPDHTNCNNNTIQTESKAKH
jgi:hypothetical protein